MRRLEKRFKERASHTRAKDREMGDYSAICEFRGRAVEGKGCSRYRSLRNCAKISGCPTSQNCLAVDVDAIDDVSMEIDPPIVNLKLSNTVRLRAGIANVLAGSAHSFVGYHGPSTVAGQRTPLVSDVAITSPAYQIAAALNRNKMFSAGADNYFGDKGGWGVAQSNATVLSVDPRVAFGGAGAIGASAGLGGSFVHLAAAGDSFSFTPTKPVDTYIVIGQNGTGVRTQTVTVGAASTALSTTNVAPPALISTTLNTALGRTTMTTAYTAGLTSVFVGILALNSAIKEMHFVNFGISGAPSARLSNGNTIGNLNSLRIFDAHFIEDFPLNDMRIYAGVAVSRANISLMIDACRANGETVVLTTSIFLSRTDGGYALQTEHNEMMRLLALEKDVPLLDIAVAWQSFNKANAKGRYSDFVHPTAPGYRFKGHCWRMFFVALMALR